MTKERFKKFIFSPWVHTQVCRDHNKAVEAHKAAVAAYRANPSDKELEADTWVTYNATWEPYSRVIENCEDALMAVYIWVFGIGILAFALIFAAMRLYAAF